MKVRPGAVLQTAIVLLFAIASIFPPYSAAEEWRQAVAPRVWSFPADHGAHPDYRTEWWYFTGNLKDQAGKEYGYQLTFFRQGIRREPADPHNPWSLRDLYLAHFTITDAARRQFGMKERASRTGPGLAGATTDGLRVWLLDWQAAQIGDAIQLQARNDGMEIDLTLRTRKPVVLHGEHGLSRKGESKGQASYYASYTDLVTAGTLKSPGVSGPVHVKGVSWFDHEFGSNQLTPGQTGWDWFSLHLSDGQELMLYLLRREDGSIEPASSGTIVGPRGQARHLPLSQITVKVLDRWKSPKSGATYPGRWQITIPSEGLELVVSPLLADQELRTAGSTAVTYWEGAVLGQGQSRGGKVRCEGYVELTGYAGSLGGLF